MSKTTRILICDDDPIVHQALPLYLDNGEVLPDSAYDGTQATKGKEYATVSSGKHTIKAVISYCDGGTETVQRVISF